MREVEAFLEFLDMGGYAAWVWPAYGLSMVGLIGIVAVTIRTLRAREQEFEQLKATRRGEAE